MSAHHAAIPKKRKARHLYDGRDCDGHHSEITAIRIATPSSHPLDVASLEAAEPGRRTKRPRFITIKCTPAYEEQARRDIAARRAAHPLSLQQAIADNDDINAVNNETFDKSLDGNTNGWIAASEEDGECDDTINDLRGKQRDAGVRVRVSDWRTRARRKIFHTVNFNAILGPCTAAYLAHKHHMDSPRSEPPPGASPSSSASDKSPSVFTVDAIDMHSYYPKKEFQVLDDIANVSLLRQGFVGCTPVQPQLAVATNVYDFYMAARKVHPSFSIGAFARTLCLVHKRSYRPGIRDQIANGWDAYLSITRRAEDET